MARVVNVRERVLEGRLVGDWLFTLNVNPLIVPAGLFQVTCTCPSPACDAWTLVGGPGTVEGNKIPTHLSVMTTSNRHLQL